MNDPFGLDRFVSAQAPVIEQVRAELAAGAKRSHWMWFIFPQIAGLGASARSRAYAIAGRLEAAAYLAHPILGPRLIDCTAIVNAVENRTAGQIFGAIDAQKFHSSITLFGAIGQDAVFQIALTRYFNGEPDAATRARI